MALSLMRDFLAGRQAPGLSSLQNRPLTRLSQSAEIDRERPHLCAARNGRYVKVTLPSAGGNVPRGNRRKIIAFSWRSRRALMTIVNSLDQKRISASDLYFATLTYPGEFPTARASKLHLAIFRRRLERRWGQMAVLWRLEPQQRGAPHYHLLIYRPGGFQSLNEFRGWLSVAWYEAVGSGDERHLRAGTNCTRVLSWGGVSTYVGKYMSKVAYGEQGTTQWHEPGRMWGVWRRERLPITYERVNVSKGEALQIRRMIVRRYNKLGTGRWCIRWPLSGKVERRYMPRHAAEMLRAENPGIQMFEYRRKWRMRSGGLSTFMNYDDLIRYIEKCWIPEETK